MDYISYFLIGFCLICAGGFLLSYLLYLIGAPLWPSLRELYQKQGLKQALKHFSVAEQLVDQQEFLKALGELEQAIFIRKESTPTMVQMSKNHHLTLITNCSVICEELSSDGQEIPLLESLLMQKAEVELLLIKAKENYLRSISGRQGGGKPVPAWGKAEYQKKLSEINANLNELLIELEQSFRTMFLGLRNSEKENITYH